MQYNFDVNILEHIWREYHVTVEADSYKEALEKCKEQDFEIVDSEEIPGSNEYYPHIKGYIDMEIFNEKGESIWNNRDEE